MSGPGNAIPAMAGLGLGSNSDSAARKAGHLPVGTFDKAMSRLEGGHGL